MVVVAPREAGAAGAAEVGTAVVAIFRILVVAVGAPSEKPVAEVAATDGPELFVVNVFVPIGLFWDKLNPITEIGKKKEKIILKEKIKFAIWSSGFSSKSQIYMNSKLAFCTLRKRF